MSAILIFIYLTLSFYEFAYRHLKVTWEVVIHPLCIIPSAPNIIGWITVLFYKHWIGHTFSSSKGTNLKDLKFDRLVKSLEDEKHHKLNFDAMAFLSWNRKCFIGQLYMVKCGPMTMTIFYATPYGLLLWQLFSKCV